MTALALTVVMPAFNEAEILESSVKSVVRGPARPRRALRADHRRERLDRRHRARSPTRSPRRSPKCASSTATRPTTAARCAPACSSRSGDAVVNFDTDFFDLDFLDAAVAQVLEPDGPAIVVGSKRGEGATDDRAALRKLATAVFSTMLRVGFGLHVSDTHGIKAMRRDRGRAVRARVPFGQDLFDTELILRVERAGLRTAEIPVGVTSCGRRARRS